MSRKNKKSNEGSTASAVNSIPIPGRFSYEGLSRAFHERARLGIMTSLLAHPQGLTFNDLKELCSLSDGNLNRHMEVLRESGYVRIEKLGAGRSAKSTCYATAFGKDSFRAYLAALEQVIQDASVESNPIGSIRLGLSS